MHFDNNTPIETFLPPPFFKMPSFPIVYTPVYWSDYAEAKAVFQMAFAYSEWAKFAPIWKNRAAESCIAARYRGTLVGVSLVSTDNVVKYIAVHPEYQGYKIGSGLLAHLLRTLTDARNIRLTTAADERLMGWYARFGFDATTLIYDSVGTFLGAHMTRRQRCRSARE